MLEPAEYVVMRLPYFERMRKWWNVFLGGPVQVVALMFAVLFSYCIGFLDGVLRYSFPVTVVDCKVSINAFQAGSNAKQGVVASKNGTTFYYPWCSGRSRIKPENERWFEGPAEALKYGLKPAKNCLGL